MAELRIRHRARIREKDVRRLNDELVAAFGFAKPPLPESVERGEMTPERDVLVAGGRVIAFILKGGDAERVFPTARLLLQEAPTKGHVTVDMGAIKFVNNGADIMAPGIVEADAAIQPGSPVWVRDERNKRPLAVGEALTPGTAMPRGPKGKAVKSLHFVGDEIWNVEL